MSAEPELLPVTSLTPLSPDVNLDLDVGSPASGGEVQLLPTTLGKGASGRVVLGMYRGQQVAVKLLDAGLMAGMGSTTSCAAMVQEMSDTGTDEKSASPAMFDVLELLPAGSAAQTLAQEVEVLARCQHPNVIRLLAANLGSARLCLVMELMDTSLERLLYRREEGDGLISLTVVLHIATQVALALSYLHPTVLHRDLKPANVLISQPGHPTPVVKLADMYAFGVIVWEMLAGRRPWEGLSDFQVAYAVAVHQLRPPLMRLSESRCPPKLRTLLVACWDPVPARRPAAAEIAKTLALIQEALARAVG
ncbi:hypothetical protein GPECTOR_6g651 [Gonium pectorale]|uniref:Protein kinase domain-containing protein n=1 Tax=Gonium pectorale TaxID=33097 RepID=A0A150GVB2_GONPE|nr:hypothetical protein GPECTOR_6g651 [Gonium pectorale]|eukprot:KXZ53734.1 hypothetical protein GPECTOR_6g651 [Gonium pectorale]